MTTSEARNLQSRNSNIVHAMIEGDEMHRGSTERTVCRPAGHNARTGTYSNRIVVFYATRKPITCKACLKAQA